MASRPAAGQRDLQIFDGDVLRVDGQGAFIETDGITATVIRGTAEFATPRHLPAHLGHRQLGLPGSDMHATHGR